MMSCSLKITTKIYEGQTPNSNFHSLPDLAALVFNTLITDCPGNRRNKRTQGFGIQHMT